MKKKIDLGLGTKITTIKVSPRAYMAILALHLGVPEDAWDSFIVSNLGEAALPLVRAKR